jgi:hypothetical protein
MFGCFENLGSIEKLALLTGSGKHQWRVLRDSLLRERSTLRINYRSRGGRGVFPVSLTSATFGFVCDWC